MKILKEILQEMFSSKNDPVKHCQKYKGEGCAHVDGMLCNFPYCSHSSILPIGYKMKLEEKYLEVIKPVKQVSQNPIFKIGEYVRIKANGKPYRIKDITYKNVNAKHRYTIESKVKTMLRVRETKLEKWLPKENEFFYCNEIDYNYKGICCATKGEYTTSFKYSLLLSKEQNKKNMLTKEGDSGLLNYFCEETNIKIFRPANKHEIDKLIKEVEMKYKETFNFENKTWEKIL